MNEITTCSQSHSPDILQILVCDASGDYPSLVLSTQVFIPFYFVYVPGEVLIFAPSIPLGRDALVPGTRSSAWVETLFNRD